MSEANPEIPPSLSLYTVPQVCKLLGIDAGKVLKWISTNELAAIDVSQSQGGRARWRVSQASLEEFLAKRSTPSPDRK